MKSSRTILALSAYIFVTMPIRADSISNGMSDAGNAIYGYLPLVQALGYAITCIVGLIGAFVIYQKFHSSAPDIQKHILYWGGSAITMLCMTIALPQFFGYNGSDGASGGYTGTGGGTGQTGGDNYGTIVTDIPGLTDSRWVADGNYILMSSNGTTTTITEYLTAVYEHVGGGTQGSYGRTLSFLQEAYNNGVYDYSTYNYLVQNCGFLPHD